MPSDAWRQHFSTDLYLALRDYEAVYGYTPTPTPHLESPTYCRYCDEMTKDVDRGDGDPPHCPDCGRVKGTIERGVDSPTQYHQLPDIIK